MTRVRRMNTIINLTKSQKDDAARQLADSQQLLEQCESQLTEMRKCRQEYAAQLHTSTSDPKTASELKGLRIFIQQLDSAIQQLEQQLVERTTVSEQHKNNWMKMRNKTRALRDIKDRYQKTEQKIIEHREQFEVDELSQRKGD